jgi:hypothetical protein
LTVYAVEYSSRVLKMEESSDGSLLTAESSDGRDGMVQKTQTRREMRDRQEFTSQNSHQLNETDFMSLTELNFKRVLGQSRAM